VQAPRDAREAVSTPAMPERDGDREHARPLLRRHSIECADQLREEILGIQFLDDQLQERARPAQVRTACREQAQRTRTHLRPPTFRIELLLGAERLFEVLIEVGDDGADLAHGSPP
jgi:hypothetical protein